MNKLRDAAAKLGTPAEKLEVFQAALAQPQFSTARRYAEKCHPAEAANLDDENPLTLGDSHDRFRAARVLSFADQ